MIASVRDGATRQRDLANFGRKFAAANGESDKPAGDVDWVAYGQAAEQAMRNGTMPAALATFALQPTMPSEIHVLAKSTPPAPALPTGRPHATEWFSWTTWVALGAALATMAFLATWALLAAVGVFLAVLFGAGKVRRLLDNLSTGRAIRKGGRS